MRTYAIWGTPTSPAHEEWVRTIGRQFEKDGFVPVDDIAEADFVLNMFDADDPKALATMAEGSESLGPTRVQQNHPAALAILLGQNVS